MMSHSFRRIALAHDLLPATAAPAAFLQERESVLARPAEAEVPEQTGLASVEEPALCASDG